MILDFLEWLGLTYIDLLLRYPGATLLGTMFLVVLIVLPPAFWGQAPRRKRKR